MFIWSVNAKEYIQSCCHQMAYFKAKMHQIGMAVNISDFIQLIVPLRQSYLPCLLHKEKEIFEEFRSECEDSQYTNEFRIKGHRLTQSGIRGRWLLKVCASNESTQQ